MAGFRLRHTAFAIAVTAAGALPGIAAAQAPGAAHAGLVAQINAAYGTSFTTLAAPGRQSHGISEIAPASAGHRDG